MTEGLLELERVEEDSARSPKCDIRLHGMFGWPECTYTPVATCFIACEMDFGLACAAAVEHIRTQAHTKCAGCNRPLPECWKVHPL